MTEPSQDELMNASAAFLPFVQRWDLPLNPEDMDQIVWALLLYSRSPLSWEEIAAAAHRQIDVHEEGNRRMSEAMTQAAKRRSVPHEATDGDRRDVAGQRPITGQGQPDVDET
ncbi:hypothetical protein [Paractinoplanes lichenicola]|uniref:Uncharacterized protein n=1 Tax=Paractinoplanes lichenicola TaxID=2802976 RepID=A0ABS1VWN4_9ACTN|nr:hypothetical protein [Actinoplanes lichenicola]MBL7258738.1 hypothetical protein [Actinoplanes lichenicola]